MIVKVLDSLLTYLSLLSSERATSFCELETVDSDRKTLIASDGSLATVIRVDGSSRLVGEDEYKAMVNSLSATLEGFMKGSGHSLQVHFTRDPDAASELVRRALEPARHQAEALQLDFKDLLDEKERELTKWVSYEALFFVCWTHPGVLSPAEGKIARRIQQEETKDFNSLRLLDVQNPRVLLSALRNRHSSYVQSVLTEMRDVGLVAEDLEAHDALYRVRYCIDPEFTPTSWKPVIPGDPIPVHFPMRAGDHSSVWWPAIETQVWPRDAKVIDGRFVRVGDRLHAPMYIDTPPVRVEPFQRLLSRTIGLDARMPWTISFLIKGNGLKKGALKNTLATVFAVANPENPFIRDATRALKTYAMSSSVVGVQVVFNTWAPVDQEDLLRQRAARLAQSVIDWGSAEVHEVTGDPVEGFTCSALALTARSVATEAAAPLFDVMHMLPITRPASPWESGAELFTSPDGKLMPYQPGSSLQTTWINLYFGGPGSGKSMQMFKQHFATCLAPRPGMKLLPQISIIDIGPSSSGLISLLRNALPANMQRYVNHFRIRNTREYAFNVFDLQLGCERPLPEERSALVDMLTMLATPSETGTPYEGTAELAGMVIDEMYKALANNERGNPHRYHPGVDIKVDEALARHSIEVDEETSWYEVRDRLHGAGDDHSALLAQRYAVPVLSDAATIARSEAIRDVYAKKLVTGLGSESLPEAFSRMIQAATREYQILSLPTQFDIGESRVTVIDLDEVAKGGGPGGQKQTSVMYAIAMYMLTRNFTLTQDNLRDFPDAYRGYHYPRVQQAAKEMKTLCCDEFHRTSQNFSAALRERVKVYAREGRKWNLQLMLGSQRLADFDDELIEMSTGIYIMERPDGGLVSTYAKRFGLWPTEEIALRTGIKGPQAGGGTFFARMKMKSGYYNQLLRNPAGPIELWAGGTTSEDKAIREAVYLAIGPAEGRLALALSYPNGSAKAECDNRKEAMVMRGVSMGANAEDDLYSLIAKEVVEVYQSRRIDNMRAEINAQLDRQKHVVEKA